MKRRDFVQRIAVSAAILPFLPYEGILGGTRSMVMPVSGFGGHVRHGLFNAPILTSQMKPIGSDWIFGLSKDIFFKNGIGHQQGAVTRYSVITGNDNEKSLLSLDITSDQIFAGFDGQEQVHDKAHFSEVELSSNRCAHQVLFLPPNEQMTLDSDNETAVLLLEGSAFLGSIEFQADQALLCSGSPKRIYAGGNGSLLLCSKKLC